jgi:hypothetical protein
MKLNMVPQEQKSEMMLSKIGDGLKTPSLVISMRLDNRFELRSEDSLDGPSYPSAALKPDGNAGFCSSLGPTPQHLCGVGGTQGQTFRGLLSTQELSSVPETNQVTPSQRILGGEPPNQGGQYEDPSVAYFEDDDFLSKINQLPGLSDADPPFH